MLDHLVVTLNTKQSYISYFPKYFHLIILGTEVTAEEMRSSKDRNMPKTNTGKNDLHIGMRRRKEYTVIKEAD